MTPEDRRRLVQLLGMLGSAHDGERADAAALADRLRHQMGATWDDLVASAGPAIEPANVEATPDLSPRQEDLQDLQYLEARWHLLTDRQQHWVNAFLGYLAEHECLTSRQRLVVDDLVAKIRRCGRAA